MFAHLLLRFGFNHHPGQGLGAGIAHHHPAIAMQIRLRLVDALHHRRNLLKRPFFPHPHVDDHLRENAKIAQQFVQRLTRTRQQIEQHQRGQQSVAGGAAAQKENMARLLPAQAGVVLLHHLQNVLVAHRRAEHADAAAAQRGFEAHVGHGRRHHQIARQLSLGLHIAGRHQHHSIPIHDPAVGVGEERAVGVAVEGDSQVRTQRLGLPGDDFRMQSAAVFVDVAAVGGYMRQVNLATKRGKKLRRNDRRGSIGAVDHNLLALEVQPGHNVTQKGLVFLAEFVAGRGRGQRLCVRRRGRLEAGERFPPRSPSRSRPAACSHRRRTP